MTHKRFHGTGVFAIEPSAFGAEHPIYTVPPADYTLCGKCAVIEVSGPLAHQNREFLTYAAIVARVKAAAASDAEIVALKIASPGGDVYGAFDCARAVKAAIKAAGKRYVAFTEAQACSSAYALASGADEIVVSDTATVGSVGVIATAADTTKADAAMGINFAIVTSGARKGDGNPHVSLTDAVIAALQVGVDATAQVFFELVAANRGLTVDGVRALEASTYVGARAIAEGLANRISTWDALIEELSKGVSAEAHTSGGANNSMAFDKDKDETRKALAAQAEDKDPEKSARAKRALAAYDEDDKEAKAEDDKGDEKKDDKEASSASSAKAEDEKKEDDKAKAVAPAAVVPSASAGTPLTAEAVAALVRGEFAARDEATQRTTLLASRPDVSPTVIKALANAPLEQIRAVLDGIPKGPTSLVPQLATAPVLGGGVDPTKQPDRLPPAEAAALDIAMGLAAIGPTVIDTPTALVLGAPQVK